MKNVMAALLLAAPAIAAQHTVSPTEHLWGLAKRYYGDPYRWRVIAEANPSIKDPHWIYPGQVVVIPDLPQEAALPVVLPAPAPMEASAPIEAAPAPAQALEPAAAAVVAPPAEERPALAVEDDSLSVELPDALSGQYPSMTRFKAPEGWMPDGNVVEYEGREALAAEGDFISGRFLKSSVSIGQKFYVLRDDAAEDLDEDKKARYLVRVGVVSVRRDLGKGVYRLLILQSGDSVQVGDRLSKERL